MTESNAVMQAKNQIAVIGYIGGSAVPNVEFIDIAEITLICVDRTCNQAAKHGFNWIQLRDPAIKRNILLGKPKVFCPKCRAKVKN